MRVPQSILALILLAGCTTGEPPVPLAEGEYANWHPDAQYVGKAVCAECHADKASSFSDAQMGRSFKPAQASASDAVWDDVTPIRDPDRNLYYQPFRRGEDLFIREFRLAGTDTTHLREVAISYIVGSGQHTNSHIRDENGYLYQVPLTWYTQERKWSLPPGFSGGDSFRFDRPITEQCMACHDGPSDYAPGSENRFSNIPHGIECENCHGAGSVHVEAIRSGRVVDVSSQIDYTIVNPAKLEIERQDDVCQRCHMQGAAVLKSGTSAFDYRPGHVLTDYMDVFWPRFPDSTSQFLMASHPDRLQMSACFQASRSPDAGMDPMTCLTCHDPHQAVEATGPAAYNATCTTCHEAQAVAQCAEDLAVRAAVNDNCASCHMPQSGTIDIPNIQITDHFIRVVDPLRSESGSTDTASRTDLVRMASLLRDEVDAPTMAAAYLTFYEEFAHRPFYLDSARAVLGRLPPQAAMRERVRLAFLEQDWNAVSRLGSTLSAASETDAWTAYRVGEGLLTLGEVPGAVSWLEKATTLAPDHLRFLDKLGTAYLAFGDLEKASAVFEDVLDRDPTFAFAWNNRGFLRLNQGDLTGGEDDFRRALSLNPDLPEALGNMASLLLNTGRVQESVPYASRLLFLDPQNAQYRQFWQAVSSAAAGTE
ncbi:MAG: Flp pilus assembly protein TadD [Rhodothermales bacterium]|jgi:Flp pilus assembly protein TadD